MKQKAVFLISICSLILTSCWKPDEFEEFRIEPMQQTWAFQVLNSTLTFKEIVERNDANTLVEVSPGSTLYFMSFRDTLSAGSAADMFQLQSKAFNLNVPVVLPAGVTSVNIPITENFEAIAGVELKRVDFSSGNLRVKIHNGLNYRILGDLIFTSLINGSNSFKFPFNLNAGTPDVNIYELDPMYLNLFDSGTNSYNKFKFSVVFDVFSGGNPVSGNIGVDVEFLNPDFEMLVGKFNQTISTGDQDIQIAVFNNTILATQHFAQPTMNYKVANSFGVPIKFRFSKFQVSNNMGTTTNVTNDGTPTAADMNLSGYNVLNYVENTSILTPALTNFTLGYLNSNIEYIFDSAPNKLSYTTEVTLGDETDSHDYFVKKSSQIQFFSDITVPLSGWATTHLLSDTLEAIEFPELIEVGISDTLDYSLTLKIKFSNELPINMDFQVKYLNENNQLIGQLFEDNEDQLIASPEIGANGESIGVKAGYATIIISKEKYNAIKEAKKLVILYKFSSGGTANQVVRVLSTNKVTIEMSVIVTATFDPQSM
jgi:hypothetical protein